MPLESCSTRPAPARLAAFFILSFALLFAQAARADSLDFVLDVLYKAGVIDGNVKAAKPLIDCLASGKSVPDCTLGAAGQTELAQDPQVQNVIDIYQSYQQQDWYAVIKKSGVTVGCALVPGGQVKDALCGELGKIAFAMVNGLGSVLGSVGDAVSSLFGSDDEAPPMASEDYYRLYFAPAYHRLVMALDSGDGSFEPLLQSAYAGCKAYYDQFEQTATNACEAAEPRLRKQAKFLHQALLQEGESWYQLHAVPKLDSWAVQHYGESSNAYVAEQVEACNGSVKAAIMLPNPGYDRCAAFKAELQSQAFMPAELVNKVDAQCRAQAKALEVLPPHDAYELACETVQKKLPVQLLGTMLKWQQRMSLADAAGCSHNDRPDSIHCDTYAARAACIKAIPDKASICVFDQAKADAAFAQEIFAQLHSDSANAGKPQRCLRTGAQVLCFRPIKQQGCRIHVVLKGDKYGLANQGDAICKLQSEAEYEQLKAQAQQVIAALNGSHVPASVTQQAIGGPQQYTLSPSMRSGLRARLPGTTGSNATPSAASTCAANDEDPLKIKCPPGFQWDANPARVAAVGQILGAPLALCGADYESDGADLPCLDGIPVAAFPSGPETPAPLPPAVDTEHPAAPAPAIRLRRIPAVRIGNDG